jgi:hypothetical protein
MQSPEPSRYGVLEYSTIAVKVAAVLLILGGLLPHHAASQRLATKTPASSATFGAEDHDSGRLRQQRKPMFEAELSGVLDVRAATR